jgi:hypothetical protein
MSRDLIGGYLTLDLNQLIKWADFRLETLLAATMLTTNLYTTGPMYSNSLQIFHFCCIHGNKKEKSMLPNVISGKTIKFQT